MCACRQKKSFFIKDILKDVSGKNKPYKNLSQEPTQPLTCSEAGQATHDDMPASCAKGETASEVGTPTHLPPHDHKEVKINVICDVQSELDINNTKVNLELRRNTYPLYPTPIKANLQWPYRMKDPISYPVEARQQFSYFSDPTLNSDQILRSHLASNGFMPHPFAIRQAFGIDRLPPGCCTPWWGIGGRRKGGQVRFSAAQTSALERRFSASKYLNPEERRTLAATLRLSDRQVKTWFQNRRAKWRRTTPDSADAGSPSEEDSDDDVQISND